MSLTSRVLSLIARPLSIPAAGRYAFALLTALIAIAVRSLPHRVVDEGSPFLIFFLSIMAAAVLLGSGPALVCLGICVLALATLFIPAGGWLGLEAADLTDLALFIAAAASIVGLLHAHRAAQARAEAATQRAEEQARRLEQEVAERRRIETALRQSNADLEDFSHAVSHDLKEPLRGISLTAEFLLEDYAERLDAPGRAKLNRLVFLPKHMSELISALLEFSRLGRAELGVRRIDMGEVVQQAVDPLRAWLTEQNAEVTIRGPLPAVACDPARMVHVFANLITNAVKYNDSTPRRVEIGARRDGPGGTTFYVADNGIGIRPDDARRVFRMFSRLHGPEAYGGGTGSGLALAKKTVERHGGRMWFDSQVGRGTTFCFTLAAEEVGAAEAVTRAAGGAGLELAAPPEEPAPPAVPLAAGGK